MADLYQALEDFLAASCGALFPVHATGEKKKKPYGGFRFGSKAVETQDGLQRLVAEYAELPDVGWACRLPDDLLVLDFDSPELAQPFLDAWEIPDTLTVRTPRGLHVYLQLAPWRGSLPRIKATDAGSLGEKIDWRCGAGGHCYAVIPPTPGYVLEGGLEIALAPERLVAQLERLSRKGDDAALGIIGPTPEGQRHAKLVELCGGWAPEIGFEQGLARARAWNESNLPPLSDAELVITVRDCWRRWGRRGAPLEPPVPAPVAEGEAIPVRPAPESPTADQMVSRLVPWLLRPVLFRGGLTYLTGDPDVGKSTLLCHLTAALTTGRALPWEPPGVRELYRVAWLLYEDDAEQTIRPRLEAAGADLSRVKIIAGARGDRKEVEVLSYDDLPRLAGDLEGYDVLLCDSLNAFLPSGLDMGSAPHVRRLLAGFGAVLKDVGLACLMVRHDRKAGGEKAIYRSSGILDWTAAARIEVTVARLPEPEDEETDPPDWPYALAYRKNNLVPESERQTWAYEIQSAGVEVEGLSITAPVITWGEQLEMKADHLVGGANGAGRKPPKTPSAKVQESIVLLARSGCTELDANWERRKVAELGCAPRLVRNVLNLFCERQPDGSWTIRPLA